MKYIELTKGKQAIVDDEDFEYLSQWKWLFDSNYARRSVGSKGKQKCIYMHKLLINCPQNRKGDHINGNKLDNRKFNLRIATVSENGMNRKVNKNNKSGLKGVSFFGGRWRAYIQKRFLGYFPTKEKAAIAYNKAAQEYFGEFARLNQI